MAVAIPAVIGAAVSLYESNKAKQQQKPYINAITGAANQQNDTAKALAPYSKEFFTRAKEAYDPAAAYYRAVAAGGPQLISAVQPEADMIGQKYGNVISTQRSLYPRSGGSNLLDVAFRAGDERQALYERARRRGAEGLAGLAGEAGNIGSAAAAGGRGAAATGITGLATGLTGTRDLDQTRADALSQFNLTPEQWDSLGTWANGKKTGAGNSSVGDFVPGTGEGTSGD